VPARTTVVRSCCVEVLNRYVPRRESITVQSYLTKSIFDGATYLGRDASTWVAGPATVGHPDTPRPSKPTAAPLPPTTTPYGCGTDPRARAIPSDTWSVFSTSGPLKRLAIGWRSLRALAAEPGLEAL
jgi:hypothetical protein